MARYRAIAEALEAQIRDGTLRPGTKLPTEMELAHQHGVSRVTAAAALAELARAGLVTRAPRRGTIVRYSPPRAGAAVQRLVAYIATNLEQTFQFEILRAIERCAREAGYGLLVATTGGSHDEEASVIRSAVAMGAAGVMLFPQDGESYNAEVLRLVLGGYPLVLVDRYLRGVSCAVVSSDNVGGSRMLVRDLLEAGHRHICVMTFPDRYTSTIEDRLAGYVQALTAGAVPVDYSLHFVTEGVITTNPAEWEPPRLEIDRFRAFMESRPYVTAIYATNALLALIALRALAEMQVHVPEDISLVCIDPIEAIPLSLPAVTAAVQPAQEIGTTAFTLLLEALDHRPPRTVRLPMHMHRAGSIGPPARRRHG